MTATLSIESIHKSYGRQQVLNDVSMSLAKGEIFGLIGLNGVGKTTLIKTLLGLIDADKGQCRVMGHAPASVDAHKNLVYLPEKFYPSRLLTGREFLTFALSYYGLPYDHEKARGMAESLDLDPGKLTQRVGSYSKGMGQKLGLLSAFLTDVPLLVLDEPMSGLDPKARIRLKQMLIQSRNAGKTIFFSSHILSDIDEICDRIGVIAGGKLIYAGTPAAFKQVYPAATLEQSFLSAIS